MSEDNNLYGISVAVARSNPLILRMLQTSSELSVGELVGLCCAALGIEPVDGRCQWEGEALSGEELLSTFIVEGTSGQIQLFDEAHKHSLELILDARSVSAGNKGVGEALPAVSEAIGLNLPEECLDIVEINRMQRGIDAGYRSGNGRIYTRGELEYSARRAENAIRRIFAPDTVEREPNRSLGMPRESIYTSIKNEELKKIIDDCELYRDSTMRKADLVQTLCRHFDKKAILRMIGEMDVGEFLDLKEFLYSDEKDIPEDYPFRLEKLYDAGLVSEVRKVGVRIATEVIECYEEVLEQKGEEAWIEEKYMRTALLFCKKLYIVFTEAMFRSVLEAIVPEDFPLEKAGDYFAKAEHLQMQIKGEEGGEKFAADHITPTLARQLRNERPPEELGVFLPEKEAILAIARDGVHMGEEEEAALIKLFREGIFYYYSYYEQKDELVIPDRIVYYLAPEGDEKMAYEEFERCWREIHWGRPSDDVARQAKAILHTVAQSIPLAIYNGYSRSNMPKAMKDYVKAHEKEPAAKKKATARIRTTVRKKK